MSGKFSDTAGCHDLGTWLGETGVSQSDLAEILGVAGSTVHRWAEGVARPGLVDRQMLLLLIGADPFHGWLTVEEKKLFDTKMESFERLKKTQARLVTAYDRTALAMRGPRKPAEGC